MTRSWPAALVLALLALGFLAFLAVHALPSHLSVDLVLGSAVVASTRSVFVLRPFTEFDWMGYSGATRSPDGRAPMVGEALDVTVIADALGVEVTLFSDGATEAEDDAMDASWVYRYDFADEASVEAYAMAVFVASSLPVALTGDYLRGLGFRKVSG